MVLSRFSLLLVPVALLAAAKPLSETYKEVSTQIIGAALADRDGYAKLSYLCDRIGNRLSGSDSLNAAIEWAAAQMKRDGLENVATAPVKVPHWVRGREDAEMVAPVRHPLTMLGLGGSVATPPDGITAEVLPVATFDALNALGREKVAGKIVLFNVPYEGYGKTVAYRGSGPSRAAKLGAVAMLLRSVGSLAMQTPHTGALNYSETDPKIPAAAITFEDATLIQRLTDAGETVSVHLYMEAHTLPDADSANVMGEILGREKPEEIVVMGGHIDSWDVGAERRTMAAASWPRSKRQPSSGNWVCIPGGRCAWCSGPMRKTERPGQSPIGLWSAPRYTTMWPPSKWMAAPKSRSGSA